MNKYVVGTILAIICAACTPHSSYYSEFHNFGDEGWPYVRSLTFTVDTLRTDSPETLYVSLRHDNSYPYRNLWLEVTYPTAQGLAIDTLNIELADIYGRWYGKGIGVSYQLQTPKLDRFEYRPGAEIKIRHVMRTDILNGIEQIGVTVQPQ